MAIKKGLALTSNMKIAKRYAQVDIFERKFDVIGAKSAVYQVTIAKYPGDVTYIFYFPFEYIVDVLLS